MDPYGLTLFSVEAWGIVLGVTGLGFVVGGGLVAKFGLGANPVRTLLMVNLAVALLGMTFTLREWAWLYVVGIFLFMCVIPAAESAEQTILQRVVPFRTQGRVFGFAQSVELAASPISAFMIGPIAEFWLIPYMELRGGPLDLGLAARQRRGARHRAGLPGRGRDHARDGDDRAGLGALPPALAGVRRRAAAAARGDRSRRLTVADQAGISGRRGSGRCGPSRRRRPARTRARRRTTPASTSTPGRRSARWVARAHGGGHVSSNRPCAMQHRLGDRPRRPVAPRRRARSSGSSSGRPCRPRKPARSSREGASGRWKWSKFCPSRLETDAQPTPGGEQAGLGGERLQHHAAAHRPPEQRDPVGVDPHVVGVRSAHGPQRPRRRCSPAGRPSRSRGSSVDSAWLR